MTAAFAFLSQPHRFQLLNGPRIGCQIKWVVISVSVMFFMFLLLVIGNYCFLTSNSLVLTHKTHYSSNNKKGHVPTSTDTSQDTPTSSSQFSPMFINIQNFTRNQNLKHNVFDRMLSDEMLSIKNNMHEKDMTYIPTLQALPKIYVATPTLVVKQNWQIERKITAEPTDTTSCATNMKTAIDDDDKSKDTSTEIIEDEPIHQREDTDKIESEAEQGRQEKILGLRSLSHYQSRLPKMRKDTYLREGKICTCMVTNPSTSCSHICTGPPTARSIVCSRKNPIGNMQSSNIRPLELETSVSPVESTPPSAYPIQYFPNYYVQMSLPPDIYDYETSTRKRKHKHRKKTKEPHYYIAYDKDLYYDNEKGPVSNKYDDDYNAEYTEPKRKQEINKVDEDDNGLAENLVKDLRKYFSEDVIKECYLSKKSGATIDTAEANVFLLVFVQFVLIQ